MSKREDLSLKFLAEESEESSPEEQTYGFSHLKISPRGLPPHNRSPQRNNPGQILSPRGLPPHNRSPQRNNPGQICFSESSLSRRDLFQSATVQRPSTLSLSLPSEEGAASITEEQILTSYTQIGIRAAGLSSKTTQRQWGAKEIGYAEASPTSPSRSVLHQRKLSGSSGTSSLSPIRTVPIQWNPKLTGSSEVSPTSPSRRNLSTFSPRRIEYSRTSSPSPSLSNPRSPRLLESPLLPQPPSRSLSNQRSPKQIESPSKTVPFRSYAIQKPWNPKASSSSDDLSSRQEQAFETYRSNIKKAVSSEGAQFSPKQIDSTGSVLANSPSPSGGTFRSYTIQRAWSPKVPGSPDKAPEYIITDERVYRVYGSNCQHIVPLEPTSPQATKNPWNPKQTTPPEPASPQAAKSPWNFKQTGFPGSASPQATKNPWNPKQFGSVESPTSPSRGILKKSRNPRSPGSSPVSPEIQRVLSGKSFSPSIFSPRASPETSRPCTPMYVREGASNVISPRQLRVKFSSEPDEIADIEIVDIELSDTAPLNPEDKEMN